MSLIDSSNAASRRVLVVEDDPILRALLVRMFVRAGLHPDVAVNGEEAIRLLGVGSYTLVLLDLMLPRVSGFEVIDFLRSRPSDRPRIVVVCTAALDTSLDRLDPSVVHGVMRKPFDMEYMSNFIEAVAQVSRTPVERSPVRLPPTGTGALDGN